ncbi:hypothetical protein BBJ28_00002672 [Nothophytophthora sp. Chile5]|nr:hypothetical protein BBJ28_00002672 [Nothophytophthora sp. Chile5]
MKCFTSALYFHPKDNNLIKAAIDKINEPDIDDDDRIPAKRAIFTGIRPLFPCEMVTATVKMEARRLLQELTQFAEAPEALEQLFDGFSAQDSRRSAVLSQLLQWQSTPATSSLAAVLADVEAGGDDAEAPVRGDMVLAVMGKPALLFATSIYDEELATLIWSGLVQFHARNPEFDLKRQVLDNSADSHGYSALHYAIEAQMNSFLREVCEQFTQEEVAPLVARVVTQDVALPVNSSQIRGKNIASGGCSLLHLAAIRGELEIARVLVAPPMAMDPKLLLDWDGNTPTQVAAIHDHQEVAEFLQVLNAPPVYSVWIMTRLEETTLVRHEVNRVAAEQGWCKQRHAAYPTTDLPCYRVAALDGWVRSSLAARLFPQIAKRYQLPKHQRLLFRDLFYVKYEARDGERAELALHRDGSVLSFNVLLNAAEEFTGGGTFFEETKRTVHITEGDAAVHSGKVRHAGAPVLSGKRQILVGFLDVADCVF